MEDANVKVASVFECYTCEDQVREMEGVPVSSWKVPQKTAIPSGTYPLVLDTSARFGPGSPHILEVPGFQGIRIHVGNTPADTEGCLIVGQEKEGGARVLRSTPAFNALKEKLLAAFDGGEPIFISFNNSGISLPRVASV